MRHCASHLPTESAYADHRSADRRRLETRAWLREREAELAGRNPAAHPRPAPAPELPH